MDTISPSAIAGIIAAILASVVFTYLTGRAANYSKNVTEERQKWREQIRKLTAEAFELIISDRTQTPEFRKIYAEFSTRLNPHDPRDRAILTFLRSSHMEGSSRSLLAELVRLQHEFSRRPEAQEEWNQGVLKSLESGLKGTRPLVSQPEDDHKEAAEPKAQCKSYIEGFFALREIAQDPKHEIKSPDDFVQAVARLLKHDWNRAI